MRANWDTFRLATGPPGQCWELFHENSKLGRYDGALSNEAILARMETLWEAFPYDRYPRVPLAEETLPLRSPLADVLIARASARAMSPTPLTLAQIGTILRYSYGVTRDDPASGYPRAFRTVPSGGALYPLEIYLHGARIAGHDPGLYHYHPVRHELRRLRDGDRTQELGEALAQPQLALDASIILFVTAVFERSTFKYGDRGYRFALLEAGHVAQNVNLVAADLGLACLNIGGYFDRQVDALLGIDGTEQSAIYLLALGHEGEPQGRAGGRLEH